MSTISVKADFSPLTIALTHTANRITAKRHTVTNEAAKRLQKYVQRSVDLHHKQYSGTLRSINRGGVHKRKLAHGSYQVYMKADYAGYVEYGTSRDPKASHFFAKAVNKFDRAYAEVARDVAKDIIEY